MSGIAWLAVSSAVGIAIGEVLARLTIWRMSKKPHERRRSA